MVEAPIWYGMNPQGRDEDHLEAGGGRETPTGEAAGGIQVFQRIARQVVM